MNAPCKMEGCNRPSRNKKKPGLCNTCSGRIHSGSSPMFPSQPLLDYMDARNISWPRHKQRPKPGSKITLEHLDAICIDVLEVHPMQVYGDLYFQECVA